MKNVLFDKISILLCGICASLLLNSCSEEKANYPRLGTKWIYKNSKPEGMGGGSMSRTEEFSEVIKYEGKEIYVMSRSEHNNPAIDAEFVNGRYYEDGRLVDIMLVEYPDRIETNYETPILSVNPADSLILSDISPMLEQKEGSTVIGSRINVVRVIADTIINGLQLSDVHEILVTMNVPNGNGEMPTEFNLIYLFSQNEGKIAEYVYDSENPDSLMGWSELVGVE
jgi:hypothetical protein